MEAKETQVKKHEFRKAAEDQRSASPARSVEARFGGYAEANRDLMQAAIDYEVWGKMIQAEVAVRTKRQLLGIFNRITNAVSEVATAKGIDLVITDQRPKFRRIWTR